jgi:hypothetical protein
VHPHLTGQGAQDSSAAPPSDADRAACIVARLVMHRTRSVAVKARVGVPAGASSAARHSPRLPAEGRMKVGAAGWVAPLDGELDIEVFADRRADARDVKVLSRVMRRLRPIGSRRPAGCRRPP